MFSSICGDVRDSRGEKAMYEERVYRRVSRPHDLICYEVACKETDLFCCTSVDLKAFIEERTLFYRNQLETYIRQTTGVS